MSLRLDRGMMNDNWNQNDDTLEGIIKQGAAVVITTETRCEQLTGNKHKNPDSINAKKYPYERKQMSKK